MFAHSVTTSRRLRRRVVTCWPASGLGCQPGVSGHRRSQALGSHLEHPALVWTNHVTASANSIKIDAGEVAVESVSST